MWRIDLNIPLVDLKRQYNNIQSEIDNAIKKVIQDTAFIQGKYVTEFESAYSKLISTPETVGCSSGTSAIFLSLRALGIKPGDEVITTTHTFIATVEAIVEAGATPVLVDIDAVSYNLDLDAVEAAINPRTRAIIPVHIYGNPVNMRRIMEMARKHDLLVVEDCAQAHLAQYNNKYIGTFGNTACFSFYPGKNLGAYGDAGAVITKDKKVADSIRKMINHGRSDKYLHDEMAYNHRMDGIQGAVLSVKIPYLKQWTEQRRDVALKYRERLSGHSNIQLPVEQEQGKHVYHLFVIQVDNRDIVLNQMNEAGIQSGIHYPVPMHLQPAMSEFAYKRGDFPIAEKACSRFLSLPMFPEMTDPEIDYVCETLIKAVS